MMLYPGERRAEVTVDGERVRYVEAGAPDLDRPPIVLVHGTGGSAERTFWALLPMLAIKHRVIALDLVDQATGEQPTLDWQVRQVGAVLEAVAPQGDALVLGHSLGAVVAARLAAEHGHLVGSLVLVAGWVTTDAQQRLRNSLWHTLFEADSPALAEFMTLTAYSAKHLNTRNKDELDALIAHSTSGPDRSQAMIVNRSIDLSADLSRIMATTLVIGCTQDWMVPIHHSRMLFGGIPNSCLAEVDAGHAVLTERPAEIFRLVHDFVSRAVDFRPGSIVTSAHA